MGRHYVKPGETFGRLTVLMWEPSLKRWLCLCECGKQHYAAGHDLNCGDTQSCGCLRSEKASRADWKIRHGLAKKRIYQTWFDMWRRCTYPDVRNFHRYGGRGIFVADEWRDVNVFYEWSVKNGYSDTLTIDRIDNNGPYSPSNCQWIPRADNIRKQDRKSCVVIGPVPSQTFVLDGRVMDITNAQ